MPESTRPASYAPPPQELTASVPTAPGAASTFPQEALDRYAALVLSVMQLRNYVALNRARLPSALLARWDAWYQGLGEVLQRTQTDQIALRQVLAQVPSYRGELESYRAAFAAHGGPAAPVGSGGAAADAADAARAERCPFRMVAVGGAGLALGFLAASVVTSRRD